MIVIAPSQRYLLFSTILSCLLFASTSEIAYAQQKIYWTDKGTDKIQRSNFDGSSVEDIEVSSILTPAGLGIDTVNNKLYFTENTNSIIRRADLSGDNIEDVISAGLNNPNDIALDIAAGKMYFTDNGLDQIMRANLDGSGVENLVSIPGAALEGIGLDLVNQKVYWAHSNANKITRADFDGSNVEDAITGLAAPTDVDVDPVAGKFYWVDRGSDKIQRANLDGTGVQDLLDNTDGLLNVLNLRLDVSGGKIYWTDNATDKVQRANLDGSGIEDLINVAATGYRGLDIDPGAGKLYWVDQSLRNLNRANTDGTNAETLETGNWQPEGIDVDSVNGKVYWTDSRFDEIRRVNLDGSLRERLITTGLGFPEGLDVDPATGKIYFADSGANDINVADLDGTNVQQLVAAQFTCFDTAVDVAGGKLYWTDTATGQVRRSDLDGMNVQNIIIGLDTPQGIDLDLVNGKVYFVEAGAQNRIGRADLDGMNLNNNIVMGLNTPAGLALDVNGGKIYWSDKGTDKIQRADLDGMNVEDLVTGAGLLDVDYIALQLDGTPPLSPIILSPTNNTTTANTTPTISGTAEANSSVEIFDGVTSLGITTTDAMGIWSLVAPVLTDGIHPITAVATDLANNTGPASLSLSITIDTIVPATPNITTSGDAGDLGSARPTLDGTAEANSSISIFDNALLIGSTTADGSGSWRFTPLSDLSFGSHNFTVTATDNANNTSSASPSASVALEPILETKTYFLWNGFLDLSNVITTFNSDLSNPASIQLRMFDQVGTEVGTANYTIPPRGHFDIIVNELDGFVQNSVGLLEIEFSRDTTHGSGFLYRQNTSSGDFEVYSGSSFREDLTGTSFLLFNVIQPSRNPASAEHIVSSWLQLANLSATDSKTFDIEFYDQLGTTQLGTASISVPALARQDLAAGHQFINERIGLIRIVPQDSNVPYLAQLMRVGANAAAGQIPESYSFLTVTPARNSISNPFWLPISRGADAHNWLVVANTTGASASIMSDYYRNDGTLETSALLTLEQFGQIHVDISPVLAVSASGAVRLTPIAGASAVAESVSYYYNNASNEVSAANIITGREVYGRRNYSAYNTFINQFDYLKLFNTTNTAISITIGVHDSDGTQRGSMAEVIDPLTGRDLSLAALSFAPSANSVGVLSIESTQAGVPLSEILRVRSVGTVVDGVASVSVR